MQIVEKQKITLYNTTADNFFSIRKINLEITNMSKMSDKSLL